MFSSAVSVISFHPFILYVFETSAKIRLGCSGLVYRKTLNLSKSAVYDGLNGKVINLIANDMSRFEIALAFIHDVWKGPVEAMLFAYFIYAQIGVAGVIGMAFLLSFIPIQGNRKLPSHVLCGYLKTAVVCFHCYSVHWKEIGTTALTHSQTNGLSYEDYERNYPGDSSDQNVRVGKVIRHHGGQDKKVNRKTFSPFDSADPKCKSNFLFSQKRSECNTRHVVLKSHSVLIRHDLQTVDIYQLGDVHLLRQCNHSPEGLHRLLVLQHSQFVDGVLLAACLSQCR